LSTGRAAPGGIVLCNGNAVGLDG